MLNEEDVENDEEHAYQLEMMRDWFFQNFENPAERTPYESAEGGYIWIWGGPYDAEEVLEEKFGEDVSEDVIKKLVRELSHFGYEWAPKEKPGDYDDYVISEILSNVHYNQNFNQAIQDIRQMLELKPESKIEQRYYRLLFISAITALETYLSDAFISTVVPSKVLMRKFIETTPDFKNEKVAMSDIYKAMEDVEKKAKSFLADLVWHNLNKVESMYKDTLGIDFGENKSLIFKSILKRHDVVHRNGKTKTGEEVVVETNEINTLINTIESLALAIDIRVDDLRVAALNEEFLIVDEIPF